jgi:hypothetical protein
MRDKDDFDERAAYDDFLAEQQQLEQNNWDDYNYLEVDKNYELEDSWEYLEDSFYDDTY